MEQRYVKPPASVSAVKALRKLRGRLLSRTDIQILRLLDQRCHDIHLPARFHLLPGEVITIFPLRLRQAVRRHRRAAGRQLINDGYVKITVDHHRQRSGDRRRRHDQHVGTSLPGPFLPQPDPLVYTETVLFIGDHQTQLPKPHLRLYHRMRPDEDLDLSFLQLLQHFSFL